MTDPDSVQKADIAEETDMARIMRKKAKTAGISSKIRQGARTLSRARRTLRGVVLMLELLAGALLVALEIRDQMADRVPDSETAKMLEEVRSLPQTVLHRTRAAATQDAETKKETASTRI